MATYSASTDYQALINSLEKQLETASTASAKASIESQIDDAEQARLEKIAANINKYGQYATDSELDSAANIAATNQIGTTYDTQISSLEDSYATAKQNASNDALSRGMARSSYVSDRLASLDSDLASGVSDVEAAKAAAITSAKQSILSDYETNTANTAASTQSDARDQISTVLDVGGTVSDSLWANSGYDASTIAALKAYAASTASTSTSSSGTSDTGTTEIPDPDNTTTGYSQLGSYAKSLLSMGQRSGTNAASMATRISKALAQGLITDTEADYLISAYGY